MGTRFVQTIVDIEGRHAKSAVLSHTMVASASPRGYGPEAEIALTTNRGMGRRETFVKTITSVEVTRGISPFVRHF